MCYVDTRLLRFETSLQTKAASLYVDTSFSDRIFFYSRPPIASLCYAGSAERTYALPQLLQEAQVSSTDGY